MTFPVRSPAESPRVTYEVYKCTSMLVVQFSSCTQGVTIHQTYSSCLCSQMTLPAAPISGVPQHSVQILRVALTILYFNCCVYMTFPLEGRSHILLFFVISSNKALTGT